MMRRGGEHHPPRGAPPPSSYFYSRPPAPSPSSYSNSGRSPMAYNTARRPEPREDATPSYYVEHLATFAVGRQFGVTFPADGIRKLRQMEKNSAIWAQPLILRFRENLVCVEDENGDLVEHFPIDLVEQPTAHVNNDPRDPYNNLLLFIVREDTKSKRTNTPTEMHIFQCNRIQATDVADDLQAYCRGQYRKVRNGRRSSNSYVPPPMPAMPQYPQDDASVGSDSSEIFERDVNTLNRCFDDIERFVARIQSAALAQREIEAYIQRSRTKRDRRPPEIPGILQMRAQLPLEQEFVDILRKFKLSFNLLAKLKNHIHEPNAPELLHFLFTPLNVILETCHWGLGKNIAPWVVSPLLSLEARELLQNCLTSKESDIWMSLGEAWRTPPEDWSGALPSPYRPVFLDGFAPYGMPDQAPRPNPIHRGQSAPPEQFRRGPPERIAGADTAPSTPLSHRTNTKQRPHRNLSVDNLELDRLSLEKDRLDFERSKMAERERRLFEEQRQIEEERRRLEAEKEMIKKEKEEQMHRPVYTAPPSQASPPIQHVISQPARIVQIDQDTTPRQKAFINDVTARGSMLVTATFDRTAQNQKELTVSRGEYLEVLDNSKNWWQCKNMLQRIGYVPHTILSVVPNEDTYSQVMPNGGSRQPSSQQEVAVQANIHPVVVQPQRASTPPQPIQQIPPAPPPPRPEDMLRPVQRQPEPQPQIYEPRRPQLEIRTRQNDFHSELTETLTRKEGSSLLRPAANQAPTTVHINERSTPGDVTRWLQEKGFSPRVIDLLDGQDGANLFSLSKLHMQQACGKEEGSYLYSQLLVQKKRSGYRTHTADELTAILQNRKQHVDTTNEAPENEPTFAIGNVNGR